MIDGRHTGTGGGNHFVLGGATPGDSPFLRRPDLLRSLFSYWHNHPSLSYLFSGLFIGPTSQAPRVDEARNDSLYELEIAFSQMPAPGEDCPPWLVDRVAAQLADRRHRQYPPRRILHRQAVFARRRQQGASACWSCARFEMPPHARMSLAQQLLLRALVARFWREPYVPASAGALGHRAARPLHAAALHRAGFRRRASPNSTTRAIPCAPSGSRRISSSASRRSATTPSAASNWSCARRWSRGTCWARRVAAGGAVRYRGLVA